VLLFCGSAEAFTSFATRRTRQDRRRTLALM
jgi:hypothetical protein